MKNTTERDIKIKDIPFLNYCSIPSMSRIREIGNVKNYV